MPNVKNKSFKIIARIIVPDGGARGPIIAQGGRFAGWAVYLKDGVPAYCHNWIGLERYYVRGTAPLAPGEHELQFEFAYDGEGTGKGGTGRLFVDQVQVGQGRIEKTVPILFSYDDTLDVGRDPGSQVTDDYGPSIVDFTGSIAWVRVDIGNDAFHDPAAVEQAMMRRQ